MLPPSRLSAWRRRQAERVYRSRIFDVLRTTAVSPRSGRAHEFHLLACGDWVNVVPLTDAGEVVLVRQFRHGTGELSLEIPGGMIDPEDPSPRDAARREMVEETGYDSELLEALGSVHPNPALMGNRCHTFLARGARRVGEPRSDGTEETEVVLVPRAALADLVRSGAITHALVIAALYRLERLEPLG